MTIANKIQEENINVTSVTEDTENNIIFNGYNTIIKMILSLFIVAFLLSMCFVSVAETYELKDIDLWLNSLILATIMVGFVIWIFSFCTTLVLLKYEGYKKFISLGIFLFVTVLGVVIIVSL